MIKSIIEYFTGPTDPTSSFLPVSPKLSLCWDFDSKSLNGIKFGDPIESIAQFGPADRFEESWINGYFCFTWSDLGLFADFENEEKLRFDYFGVLVGPDEDSEKELSMTYGSLSTMPGNLIFNSQTTRSMFDDIFGAPSSIESDDKEHIRFYCFDGHIVGTIQSHSEVHS